ncbi:2-keto-4-pentenoate hydratase [Vibrio parahaemolyticus]|uniref:2-keto-4-pentenoate hydratase n=1 Tax=Vibrio mediterranei TaxID=689 RepID=UPI004067A0EA
MDIKQIAKELYHAEKNSIKIEKLSVTYPEITVDQAYRIQLAAVEEKLADGQIVVGKKIGLSNFEMQKALGISEPDYGHILSDNMADQDNPLRMSEMVQPMMEAELAFVLDKDIQGPGVTAAQVMAATKGIIPAFEVVDSRFSDIRVALQDTIADNASCGRVILGSTLVPINDLDLRTIGLVLEKNGRIIDTAASATVLGSPAASVAWLANKIAAYGVGLKAGEIIMSGSFTNIVKIEEGDVFEASFGGVGKVKASFVK